MFKKKAKQIVKDILQSVGKENDPIKTLMEPYVEKQLKEAYNMGSELTLLAADIVAPPQNKSK